MRKQTREGWEKATSETVAVLIFVNLIVKIDKTIIKETKYVASFVVILSVLMQAVFLIVAKWNYTVLLGNIWGAALAVGNFFTMALYVQKAVLKDEKDAKQMIKASHSIRFIALAVLTGLGVALPFFNWITVVVPLIFPSIAAFLRQLTNKE